MVGGEEDALEFLPSPETQSFLAHDARPQSVLLVAVQHDDGGVVQKNLDQPTFDGRKEVPLQAVCHPWCGYQGGYRRLVGKNASEPETLGA